MKRSTFRLICLCKSLSKILETTGNTLTGLQFFVFTGSYFFETWLTSANFNSAGKLDVNKVLLNSSAKVSEQLSLLALKMSGGIFPNVLAFLY